MKITVTEKAFAGRSVLQDIDLTLKPGAITCLCGPSGCGKTTLLRIIGGLDDRFDGTLKERPETIGYVFQEPRLLPWRTVMENLEIAVPDPVMPFADLLALVGLEGQEQTLAAKLSLGMARRVSIVRALAAKPDLLILDEPFVSLDHHRAEGLRRVLYDYVAHHQIKTVLVSHNPSEAVEMAAKILVIDGQPGRIHHQLDVPLNITERQSSAAVASFVTQHQSAFTFQQPPA